MVVYDSRCSVCRGVAAWIRRRDARGALAFLPCQAADLEERLPHVTRADCEREVLVALPDGTTRAGADAIPEILSRLPRWRLLAPLLRHPTSRPLAARLYEWIALHRPRDA